MKLDFYAVKSTLFGLLNTLLQEAPLYPFECKPTSNPSRRDASGINAFTAAYPNRRIGKGVVICAVERPRWISEEVPAVPWNLL